MAKLLAPTFPVAPGDRNGSDMRKRRGAPSHLCPVIGNPGYSALDEHQIQVALFKAYKARRNPVAVMFAIPNGGERRDAISGRQLKLEGVTAGAPDIFCCVDGKAFLMELKTETGVLSISQRKFHKELVAAGIRVIVCKGFLEAVHTLETEGVIRLPKKHRSIRHDEDEGGAPAWLCVSDRSRSGRGRAGTVERPSI